MLAILLGMVFVLGSVLDGPLLAGILVGGLALATGVVYFSEDRAKPSRYKWAALPLIPAFVLFGATVPEPAPERVPTASDGASSVVTTAPAASATSPISETPLPSPPTLPVVDSRAATDALSTLAKLPVAVPAPSTGYEQSRFGQPWSDDVGVDAGHNDCDTRNDILRRDLTAVTIRAGSHGCVVTAGTLDDAYTGVRTLLADETTLGNVSIDHVVALSDAWQKGIQGRDPGVLQNFANDPRNLQATTIAASTDKAGRDAATWLPTKSDYRCTYVVRQIEVKAAYQLSVTQAERDAMEQTLLACGAIAPITVTPEPAPSSAPPTTTLAPSELVPPPPVPITPTSSAEPPPAPPRAPAPAPAPAPGGGPWTGGSCGPNSYTNVDGDCIPGPVEAPSPPAGATARCRDGTYSFSQNRRGTCSSHGGVAEWL